MILISHRGNLNGKSNLENKPEYLKQAMLKGYGIETDVWLIGGKLYLGHDNPEYPVEHSFVEEENVLCHAKNKEALEYLIRNKLHVFWHDEDEYTITSKGNIICHPKSEPIEGSIFMLPEIRGVDVRGCIGICSDYIENYD